MIRSRMVGLLIGLLVVGVVLAPAYAGPSVTKTMDELVNGGQTLELGDKIVENWATIGTGLEPPPDLTTVKVTLTELTDELYCLDYQGVWNAADGETRDWIWSYDIRSTGALITDAHALLVAPGVSGESQVILAEALWGNGLPPTPGAKYLGNMLVTDKDPYKEMVFEPYQVVHVEKNLSLVGKGGEAHISHFQQCFSQVPEGTTCALFGLGLAGLVLLRRKR